MPCKRIHPLNTFALPASGPFLKMPAIETVLHTMNNRGYDGTAVSEQKKAPASDAHGGLIGLLTP